MASSDGTGPAGPVGPVGPAGPSGTNGTNGVNGVNGAISMSLLKFLIYVGLIVAAGMGAYYRGLSEQSDTIHAVEDRVTTVTTSEFNHYTEVERQLAALSAAVDRQSTEIKSELRETRAALARSGVK